MIHHMYEHFLTQVEEYRQSEAYWADLWSKVNPLPKAVCGWETPWLGTGSPTILDGNPIFTAYSPASQQGIRIIQHPPTSASLEFAFWLDTFGGSIMEPGSIRELVISCALSDVAGYSALSLINKWVEGEALTFEVDAPARVSAPEIAVRKKRLHNYTLLPAA